MQRRAGCSVFINPARQPGLHGALPHTWDGGFDQRPRIFFARRVCASASWRLGGGEHAGRSRSWPHNLVGRGWANVAAGVGPRRAEGSLGGPRWSSLGQVPSLLLASHIALQRERGQGVCRPCWVLGEANGQGADPMWRGCCIKHQMGLGRCQIGASLHPPSMSVGCHCGSLA
jgi:hypothetical protein